MRHATAPRRGVVVVVEHRARARLSTVTLPHCAPSRPSRHIASVASHRVRRAPSRPPRQVRPSRHIASVAHHRVRRAPSRPPRDIASVASHRAAPVGARRGTPRTTSRRARSPCNCITLHYITLQVRGVVHRVRRRDERGRRVIVLHYITLHYRCAAWYTAYDVATSAVAVFYSEISTLLLLALCHDVRARRAGSSTPLIRPLHPSG